MAHISPNQMKPTLDKDLDKFTRLEEATHHVSRRLAAPGAGLLFLITAAIFAGAYVAGKPGALIILAAVTIGAYMAMNIGANDVTNNVGPAVGAKAISMTAALIIAAVFEIAGALLAGGQVVETISSGIINPGTIPDPNIFIWAMMAALLAAALWVNLATWINAPISTTHAIVGGVAGAGVAAYGLGAVEWTSMIGIALTWMVSPVLSGLIAIAFLAFIKQYIIYTPDKIEAARLWVPVLIGVMAGVFITYLAADGLHKVVHLSLLNAMLIGLGSGLVLWRVCVPLIRKQSQGLENRNQSLRVLFQIPLIFAAALLSFSHGANDVSNAIGPVAAIVQAAQRSATTDMAEVPHWVMLIGAFGLSCGILLFGPRLIRLVGEQITKLNPMRAFCVSLSTALTVLVASSFGMPLSTTHTAVGAVFGVGFFREWYTRNSRRRLEYMKAVSDNRPDHGTFEYNASEMRRRYLVRRSHLMTIGAAWIITVPLSATLAALLYWIMFQLFV